MSDKVHWYRGLGELLADLQNGQELGRDEVVKRLTEAVDDLPDRERQSATLAYLIRRMSRAESGQQVEDLLTEGMKVRLVLLLREEEAKDAKQESDKRSLLVFAGSRTWGPVDFNNKAHQALVISARQAMGRLKAEAAPAEQK